MSSAAGSHVARNSLLGSLKDALAAASKDETMPAAPPATVMVTPPPMPDMGARAAAEPAPQAAETGSEAGAPSAADAAREARGGSRPLESAQIEGDRPPTTRVVRAPSKTPEEAPRTSLVRGRQQVKRGAFEADPVVGWLVVVGGPGIGQFRPVFEGNNTVGRSAGNRVAIDFGDDAISGDEQAYIRYDSSDRSFLFVPNLAKTNVVSVNERRPTGAVELAAMDVITMGRTQLVFVPFCGPEFDWSALADG